jgi:hypothetical protein
MTMGSNTATDAVTYAFIVAGILVLTRTGSGGAAFASAVFNGLTGLVQGASGQTVKSATT